MQHYYWNDLYTGWGWLLWLGVIFVIFSSFGNWGYTYRVHRRFDGSKQKNALDILHERYASGEINYDEYIKMKSHITGESDSTSLAHREVRKNTSTHNDSLN